MELAKPIGKNNGTVGGFHYFTCPPNHGVLVVPTKVTPINKAAPEILASSGSHSYEAVELDGAKPRASETNFYGAKQPPPPAAAAAKEDNFYGKVESAAPAGQPTYGNDAAIQASQQGKSGQPTYGNDAAITKAASDATKNYQVFNKVPEDGEEYATFDKKPVVQATQSMTYGDDEDSPAPAKPAVTAAAPPGVYGDDDQPAAAKPAEKPKPIINTQESPEKVGGVGGGGGERERDQSY